MPVTNVLNMDEGRSGGVAESNASATTITPPNTSVIINIPPSSPRSPRLAHLRPPSPLTPEAMHRINLLTVQETGQAVDASKLSPISPLYPTSDLGSSPRSSISVTTCSTWSAYRDHKKSSSDFTDADSDMCKDLFSPGIMLSPAPFSPFSDNPDAVETPAFSDPTWTPLGQRLRFTFDPKSPSFMPMAPRSTSHFLLPPVPTLGVLRERSRSDSDTVVDSNDDMSTSEGVQQGEAGAGHASAASSRSAPRRPGEGHKYLYKKRLLRKYAEETNADSVSASLAGASVSEQTAMFKSPHAVPATVIVSSAEEDEPTAPKNGRSAVEKQRYEQYHPPLISIFSPNSLCAALGVPPQSPISPTYRSPSSLSASSRASSSLSSSPNPQPSVSAHPNISVQRSVESASLPLLRVDTNLSNQTYFDWWLKQQLLAVNTLWYPNNAGPSSQSVGRPVSSAPPPPPVPPPVAARSPAAPAPPSVWTSTAGRRAPQAASVSAASLGPIKCRRSRSESDVSYVCQHCGQSFSLHDRLAKHVASRHRDRSSSTESALKSHSCTVCHKRFGRSDMLTRHMRLHTGIKPYACRVCGQVFSRSDHLSTHHRTHTGEKPYQCPQCSYAASRRDMITRHMRTHTRPGGGVIEQSTPNSGTANVGYVSVIRRTTSDRDSSPSDCDNVDEITGSQLTTPRISRENSDRASTGSASTILCVEDEDEEEEMRQPDSSNVPSMEITEHSSSASSSAAAGIRIESSSPDE